MWTGMTSQCVFFWVQSEDHIKCLKEITFFMIPSSLQASFSSMPWKNSASVVRRQVLTTSARMVAFWGKALCSFVEVDRHIGVAYCLHHQGYEVGGYIPGGIFCTAHSYCIIFPEFSSKNIEKVMQIQHSFSGMFQLQFLKYGKCE
jgi:hypothetical protein